MSIFFGIMLMAVIILAFAYFYSQTQLGTPPPVPAPPVPKPVPTCWKMSVPPGGTEAFTPVPLLAGRVYRVTFTGTYSRSGGGSADAIFYTDAQRNFTQRYTGVEVAGYAAGRGELDSWTENRADHRYSCLIEGTGDRCPIRIIGPKDWKPYGQLIAEIELLPVGAPRVAARYQAAAAARALEAQKEEAAQKLAEQQELQRQLQAEQDRRQAEIQLKVHELSVRVHHDHNWLDPAFCEEYVKKHQHDIAQSRSKWMHEYQTLMADAELVGALRTKAPEVLDFYERRVDMIRFAERLAVMPQGAVCSMAAFLRRRITSRTIGQVENAVSELFTLRDQIDRLREQQARKGFDGSSQELMEQQLRAMAFRFELLKAYGITADTPESAEEKFFELCPYQPVLTLYEQLAERIAKGEQVSPDAVRNRLEDLYREEIILQARRRWSVRRSRDEVRDDIDDRLTKVRREATELRDFMTSLGLVVSFPDYRQLEESREERFYKLLKEKDNMQAALVAKGDSDAVENLEAFFAQELARLFEITPESY